jgi:hypothetical protein
MLQLGIKAFCLTPRPFPLLHADTIAEFARKPTFLRPPSVALLVPNQLDLLVLGMRAQCSGLLFRVVAVVESGYSCGSESDLMNL